MSATVNTTRPLSVPLEYSNLVDDALQCIEKMLSESHRPVVSTKFSPDSAVFLHLLQRVVPDIPVIWVDTGYNTRDTLRFATYMQDSFGLDLRIYRPLQVDLSLPPEPDTKAHNEFTQSVKLEPFRLAFEELKPDLWFSSLRRYQSIHRSELVRHEVMDRGLTKVLPILEWTADTVEWYRQDNDLPSGPDVFDPTKGMPFRECGLHTTPWRATA